MKYYCDYCCFLLMAVVVIFISDHCINTCEAYLPEFDDPGHELLFYNQRDKNKNINCTVFWDDWRVNPDVELYKNGSLFETYSRREELSSSRASWLFSFNNLQFTPNDNGSRIQCRANYMNRIINKDFTVYLYNNTEDVPECAQRLDGCPFEITNGDNRSKVNDKSVVTDNTDKVHEKNETRSTTVSSLTSVTDDGDRNKTASSTIAPITILKEDTIFNISYISFGVCIIAILIVYYIARAAYKCVKKPNEPKLHPEIERRFFKGEDKKVEFVKGEVERTGANGVLEIEMVQMILPFTKGPYRKRYEIPMKKLEIKNEELGRGHFGVVYKGHLTRKTKVFNVACKTVKPIATDRDNLCHTEFERAFELFLREIKIIQCIGHHDNVVSYMGSVTKNIRHYEAYLVVECCLKEDLGKFLRENRSKFVQNVRDDYIQVSIPDHYSQFSVLLEPDPYVPIDSATNENEVIYTHNHLLQWAIDIATGMEYLSRKSFIHCDLATRNILLSDSGDRLVAKINDFGLSKHLTTREGESDVEDVYYRLCLRTAVIPALWTAPEVMHTGKVSVSSDIWSFGVTMWEIFSLGETPYIDEEKTTESKRIRDLLSLGVRLDNPLFATSAECRIMKNCWEINPQDRPRFSKLKKRLLSILDGESVVYENF